MTTFNANELNQFTLELSHRDIYNDIRSETDVTEKTEVQGDGTPAEHQEVEIAKDGSRKVVVAANSSEYATFTAELGHTDITWLDVEVIRASRRKEHGWSEAACEAAEGTWHAPFGGAPSTCYFPDIARDIDVRFTTRRATTATVRVTNPHSYEIKALITATYQYLVQEAIEGQVTIDTHTRLLTVRSVDATSIRKYGRRTMNLVWPLGQSQEQVQSLVDSYRDRYSEPVSFASMTIEGSDDTKIAQILAMDTDDKCRIIHLRLAMDEEFFVNNVNVEFNREGTGILTGTFALEQVRDMEKTTYFIIGSSLIGGPHVIAP